MGKLLYFVLATVGGAVGWWAGEFVGMMTAFVLSMVGTGVGIYFARRWSAQYFS